MRQSGEIALVNSTDSLWVKTDQKVNKIRFRPFPERIDSQSTIKMFIELDDDIQNSYIKIEYRLNNAENNSFQIIGEYNDRSKTFEIKIDFNNIIVNNNYIGYTERLVWEPNGIVNFILFGKSGSYKGTYLDASKWMTDSINLLGDVPLGALCILGSHDAGMDELTTHTQHGAECNTLTQSQSIFNQLYLGVRYLDIRPVIKNGAFFAGHYSHNTKVPQGGTGQPIENIISDINSFTLASKSRNEVIMIRLSHDLNVDLDKSFTQEEWDQLFSRLDRVNYLYDFDHPIDDRFTVQSVKLNDFTKNGTRAAILFVVENNQVNLGRRNRKGFFYAKNFPIYDSYSNTNDMNSMAEDQIDKMKTNAKEHYFLLSWILTQQWYDLSCDLYEDYNKTIMRMAKIANKNLFFKLYQHINLKEYIYPNIIYIDNVKDSNPAALSMAINFSLLLDK